MHILKSKLGRFVAVLCSIVLTLTIGSSPARADAYQPPANDRVDFNFNPDWKFLYQKDDPAAAQPGYDDASWQNVTLPHTWNDIDTFQTWNNAKKKWGGICWYRKHFTLDPAYAGRKVIVEFECISLQAKFYINGQAVGSYSSGVSACGVDISDYVKFGSENVLAVQVDNRGGDDLPGEPFNPNFGGLNRDVILHIANKVYQTYPLFLNLGTTGTYVYEQNIDTANKTADMHVDAEVKNDNKTDETVTASAVVVDRDGNKVLDLPGVAQSVPAGKVATIKLKAPMTGIHFWSPDYPYMYKVYSTLSVDGKPIDVDPINIGVRLYTFSVTKGLEINGHQVYLKGYAPRTSMEWAAVSMPPDWLIEYDFKLMKEDNGNFCRPMHMAPKRAQVDAANRLGVIMVCPGVDGENDGSPWPFRRDTLQYATIYFRNDPSVAFYEGCNGQLSAAHAADALAIRKTYDPYGGRMAGMRSNDKDVTISVREYSGTMDGESMNSTTPVWDAEYARGECPRHVWDSYSPMLNPRWDGKSSDPTPYPPVFTTTEGIKYPDTTHKYLTGGFFFIVGDPHQKLGFNVGDGVDGDTIRNYIKDGQLDHGYFRLNTSEDMVLENLAKYWARYSHSAIIQDPAISASKGIFSGGAKIIYTDSYTDGRLHDTQVSRVSGVLDAVRLPKEVYYGLQVAQNVNPQVYVVGHWNYPAGTVKRVYVVSNTAKVQLQTFDANGALIKDYGFGKNDFVAPKGDQANHYCYAFENVAWQPGKIKATGYDESGKEVASNEIVTAGPPAALKLTQIQSPSGKLYADGNDIAMVNVEVVDDKGERCPTYEDRVDFTCSGTGATFLGGYNDGIQHSILTDRNNGPYHFVVECGINRVFIRGTRTPGSFTLNVTGKDLNGKDLKPASISLTSSPVDVKGGLMTDHPQITDKPELGPEPAAVKADGNPVGSGETTASTFEPDGSIQIVQAGKAPYAFPAKNQFSFDVGN